MTTKMHLAVDRPGPFGGTVHTTLCNRISNASDDSNRTSVKSEVTCAICRRRIIQRRTETITEIGCRS